MAKSNPPKLPPLDSIGGAVDAIEDMVENILTEVLPDQVTTPDEETPVETDGYRVVAPGVKARSASEAMLDARAKSARAEAETRGKIGWLKDKS